MTKSKKLFACLTLLVYLAGWTPIARAENEDEIDADGDGDGDYVELRLEEPAPFDGFLLHKDAMVKLIVDKEKELNTLKLSFETESKKLKLDIETVTKKKDIELQINKEMYDALLQIRQDRIDALQKEANWGNAKLIGGVVLGFAVSVAMFYAAVQVAR